MRKCPTRAVGRGLASQLLAVALALAPIACGGGGSADSLDAAPHSGDAGAADAASSADAGESDPCVSPQMDYAAFAACTAQARCEVFAECFVGFADREECTNVLTPAPGEIQHRELQIETDLVEFDGETAAACVEAIRAESACRAKSGSPLPRPCHLVFHGTVGEGQGCFDGAECADEGAVCDTSQSDCEGSCCAGVCRQGPGAGEDCTEANCRPGLRCADGTCTDGTEGAGCDDHDHCRDPYWCRSGTCTAGFAPGQVCDADEQCPPEHTCLGDDLPSQNLGTCEPSSEEGDRCDGDSISPIAGGCIGALYCDRPDPEELGTCRPVPSEEGAECEDAGRCASAELYCLERDDDPDLCAQLPGEGEPCAERQCAPALFCSEELGEESPGTCLAPQAVGETCWRPRHCESNRCSRNDPADPGVCEEVATCR